MPTLPNNVNATATTKARVDGSAEPLTGAHTEGSAEPWTGKIRVYGRVSSPGVIAIAHAMSNEENRRILEREAKNPLVRFLAFIMR